MAPTRMKKRFLIHAGTLLKASTLPALTLALEVTREQFSDMLRLWEGGPFKEFRGFCSRRQIAAHELSLELPHTHAVVVAQRHRSPPRQQARFTGPSAGLLSLSARARAQRCAPRTLCLGTRLLHTPLSTEKSMAKKPNKTKSKRRSTTMSKARRSGSKPLMAKAASVRTAKPRTSVSRASNGKPPSWPVFPTLTVIATMGRVMGAYAEFPTRLAQCRSPMDIWSEQARFVQRVFNASLVSADRPLPAQVS